MSVFHQMGHDSENLLKEDDLSGFAGAIMSPVNCDQAKMTRCARDYRQSGDHEVIFDSQLYYPRNAMANLARWPYFPDGFETADEASDAWWSNLVARICRVAGDVNATAVCSPAIVPRVYADSYYDRMVSVAALMQVPAGNAGIELLQTVIISMAEISEIARVHAIASIVTRTHVRRAYLVFVDGLPLRRENTDSVALAHAMLLVHLLESNGIQVLVGFSSSDILLWKESGASACATGKFWNLRRFTPGRWDPDDDGGFGQLPYWLEESLVASLRESDLLRIERAGLISEASGRNPYSQPILDIVHEPKRQTAWLGLGWRHYLFWFCDIEERLSGHEVRVRDILGQAEDNWETVEDLDIFMEDRRNDGRWIRPWLIALSEYRRLI